MACTDLCLLSSKIPTRIEKEATKRLQMRGLAGCRAWIPKGRLRNSLGRQSQFDESFLYDRGGLFSRAVSKMLHPDCHSENCVRAGLLAWEHFPGGSVYKRQCCCPHPCPSGCLVDSGLSNMSGYAVASPSLLSSLGTVSADLDGAHCFLPCPSTGWL